MAISETRTLADVRKNFPSVLNDVTLNRKTIIIKRRNAVSDAAIIAADDLRELEETAYLFSSPANAKRLLESFVRIEKGEYQEKTIEALKKELGFSEI